VRPPVKDDIGGAGWRALVDETPVYLGPRPKRRRISAAIGMVLGGETPPGGANLICIGLAADAERLVAAP